MLADSDGTFLVGPDTGLIVWSGYAVLALIALIVVCVKGRWGWALLGFATAGLLWFVGAFLSATPKSIWSRLRDERAAA
jgi:uncharacterized membrane protein YbhN (UPF0104 family)